MRPQSAHLASLIILATVLACSDAEAPNTLPTEPSRVATAVASTNGQSALRGNALPLALKVIVTSAGAGVGGVHVVWRPLSGSVALDTTLTGPDGIAATTWILGPATGQQTLEATVEGLPGDVIRFSATALPLITLTPAPGADNQVGTVGSDLPQPLQVTVLSDGVPATGVVVGWRMTAPYLSAVTYSTSGPDGVAVMMMRLPSSSGQVAFRAEVSGVGVAPALFRANALSAEPATVTAESGDSVFPVNVPFPGRVVHVTVRDRFGNGVAGAPIAWTVTGPFALVWTEAASDSGGGASASVIAQGTLGAGHVLVSTVGGLSLELPLHAVPPIPAVLVEPGSPSSALISLVNRTTPAIDTIPVGGTMSWYLSFEDLDYHRIESVQLSPGDPVFTGGNLDYGATVHPLQVTFTAPGTYHYEDSGFPGAIGTLVVR